MAKKTKKIDVNGQGFGGTMADLLKGSGLAPPQSSDVHPPSVIEEKAASTLPDARLWRAQVERKGRKGKTVTRLYGVELNTTQTQALCSAMGKAMGARVFVEEGEILIQGKHADRALKWLRAYKG